MSYFSMESDYGLFDDEESDSNNDTSSDDDIDTILKGTQEQRQKLKKLHNRQIKQRSFQTTKDDGSVSSEDDFEKEMNAELNENVKYLEAFRGNLGNATNSARISCTDAPPSLLPKPSLADTFYDDVYFDSDEEQEETKATGSTKHSVISNDDLLYDPHMDDRDQRWVDGQRRSHRSGLGKHKKMPNSDALLDCPACLTTLCIDCQRHDSYKHQFRAMFVMNCEVDVSETLQCPEMAPKKKKKKKKDPPVPPTPQPQDMFHPVKCTECRTTVGVVDRDEVYHFFNVLASHT